MENKETKGSALDAILNQYEKNMTNTSVKPKVSNEERLKKYFTEKLQKGEKATTKRFRILPAKEKGSSPFAESYFHEMLVNNKWEKIYCTEMNDGQKCHLCEAKDALQATGGKKEREMAKEYNPKKFYVIKGIDRDKEDDGVKFWRFKHNYMGGGIMDKIIPLFKLKGDLSDPREGRDVVITTQRNDKGHSVVNSVTFDDVSILTSDKTKAVEWMSNEDTFKTVYSKKPVEFVEIVAKRMTPIWDSELGKYVAEEEKENKESASLEDEINMMKSEDKKLFGKTTNQINVSSMDDDEELPF